jgi:hypothetical protein
MYKLDLYKLDPPARVLLAIVFGLQVDSTFLRPCGAGDRELLASRPAACGR